MRNSSLHHRIELLFKPGSFNPAPFSTNSSLKSSPWHNQEGHQPVFPAVASPPASRLICPSLLASMAANASCQKCQVRVRMLLIQGKHDVKMKSKFIYLRGNITTCRGAWSGIYGSKIGTSSHSVDVLAISIQGATYLSCKLVNAKRNIQKRSVAMAASADVIDAIYTHSLCSDPESFTESCRSVRKATAHRCDGYVMATSEISLRSERDAPNVPFVASLLLVVRPGATSTVLL